MPEREKSRKGIRAGYSGCVVIQAYDIGVSLNHNTGALATGQNPALKPC
ncbi:MAG: hypothetical protein ACRBCK_05540 [Alphaproteobacteria bacterium]